MFRGYQHKFFDPIYQSRHDVQKKEASQYSSRNIEDYYSNGYNDYLKREYYRFIEEQAAAEKALRAKKAETQTALDKIDITFIKNNLSKLLEIHKNESNQSWLPWKLFNSNPTDTHILTLQTEINQLKGSKILALGKLLKDEIAYAKSENMSKYSKMLCAMIDCINQNLTAEDATQIKYFDKEINELNYKVKSLEIDSERILAKQQGKETEFIEETFHRRRNK